VVSHDSAAGRLLLENDRVTVRWPTAKDDPVYRRLDEALAALPAASAGGGDRRGSRLIRIIPRRPGLPRVARTGEHLVEFRFQHGFEKFAAPIAKAGLDWIELVVEKLPARFDFRLQQARIVLS
jgi:hypothetical protein